MDNFLRLDDIRKQQLHMLNTLACIKKSRPGPASAQMIVVAGKERYYSNSWTAGDYMENEVIQHMIFKMESPDHAESLFGYDEYFAYVSISSHYKDMVVICPSVIVDETGKSTGLVIMRILRTRCFNAQYWPLLYNIDTFECEIVRNCNVFTFLHKDQKTKTPRKWMVDVSLTFDEPTANR